MRRIFAEVTLVALMAACSEQPTAPAKKLATVAPVFTNNVEGGADVVHPVLCSNASGSVFVRLECSGNEQQLDPVALGLVGPQGPAGPQGPSGVSGYQIVAHQEFLSAGSLLNVHVECPTGKKVLGGGFDIESPTDVKVFSSEPGDGHGNFIDHGWNAFVQNAGSSTRQTTVSAICASVQ